MYEYYVIHRCMHSSPHILPVARLTSGIVSIETTGTRDFIRRTDGRTDGLLNLYVCSLVGLPGKNGKMTQQH